MKAKSIERSKAQRLRQLGRSINKIALILNVSTSTVIIWVKDIPQPEQFTKEYKAEQKRKRLQKIRKGIEERKEEKRIKDAKGYRTIHVDGYYWLNKNGKRILEHRYIMEKHLGRKLESNKYIHHINEDKTDNRLCNLKLTTNVEHMKHHPKERPTIELICPTCKNKFIRRKYKYDFAKKNEITMHCSRSCSGKNSHMAP